MCHVAMSQTGDNLRSVTEIPFSENVTLEINSEMLFRASLPKDIVEKGPMAVSIRTSIEVSAVKLSSVTIDDLGFNEWHNCILVVPNSVIPNFGTILMTHLALIFKKYLG